MSKTQGGFTLVELMIAVVVLGILAAVAIPNYMVSEVRAREAGLKSNMHTFQLAAENFRTRSDTTYAGNAADVAELLQGSFDNPFDESSGKGAAWEDRASCGRDPSSHRGITSYADSLGMTYNIKGYGEDAALALVLTSAK